MYPLPGALSLFVSLTPRLIPHRSSILAASNLTMGMRTPFAPSMPKLIDLPYELRSAVYAAYFTSLLADHPRAELHKAPLLVTNTQVATEALRVRTVSLSVAGWSR